MNFTFVCQSCEEDFVQSYDELLDRSGGLKCPNCKKRISSSMLEEFTDSVDEVLAVVASWRPRFLVSFDVDAESLPAAFAAESDEDELVEEDDDIDDEELLLDEGELDEDEY